MTHIFSNITDRRSLDNTKDVILWWNKGRLFLNLVFYVICILHLLIVWFVLKNGWIVFYLPMLAFIWGLINIFFSLGMVVEIVAKMLKLKIDFDKIGPSIKIVELVIIGMALVFLSMLDIVHQLARP